MDLYEEVSRGQEAKDILEKPLIQEFLTTIRDNLRNEFENSKALDKEGREEVWRMLKVVNEFERHFISIITTGEMAKQQLNLLERTKEKIRSIF